jgi:ribonuclease BN (tRNA processing enzyme)
VLDAGSGIRALSGSVGSEIRRVDVLVSHLHMDHIQGLGFFEPLFHEGRRVQIWGPPSTSGSLARRLGRYLSPPLFPVRLNEVASIVSCQDVINRTFDVGSFQVTGELVCHPDPTLGYRISCEGKTVAYLPDHEPQLGTATLPRDQWLSGFSLAEGADLLIHDAQYTADEYRSRVGWGHCTVELAVRFAERVDASKLLLFHHDPAHSDDALEHMHAVAAELETEIPLQVHGAVEDEVYVV